MHFIEIDIFGVYIAPMVAIMVVAYLLLLGVRFIFLSTGLLALVWHPALFQVAVYVIILAALILLCSSVGITLLHPVA